MFWYIFEEYITPIGLSLVAIILMVLIVIEGVAIIRDLFLDSKERAKRIKRIYE